MNHDSIVLKITDIDVAYFKNRYSMLIIRNNKVILNKI